MSHKYHTAFPSNKHINILLPGFLNKYNPFHFPLKTHPESAFLVHKVTKQTIIFSSHYIPFHVYLQPNTSSLLCFCKLITNLILVSFQTDSFTFPASLHKSFPSLFTRLMKKPSLISFSSS